MPLVSVIIPHQAGAEVLVHCLQALTQDRSNPDIEIIVVDNASKDGSVEEAQARFPSIQVLGLEENQGFAGGCNRGIEASRGAYVLLLNDDTEVEPGCLAGLVRVAEANPDVGACQPKIRSLRERALFEYSGAAGGLMDLYGYPFSRGRLMGHVEADKGQYDDFAEVFWASGVCMLMRRSALDVAGLFDETFFAYMEEIDLSWRLQLQGYHVVYVPTSVVYHIGGYSLDQRVLKRMYLNHRNSVIMLIKNYSARSLLWILPVKLFLELFILFGALLRNPRRSRAVIMSFGWLLSHVPTVLRLRFTVQRSRRVPDREIFTRLYHGMAPLWYFVFGIRRVTDLPDIDRILHQPYGQALGALRNDTVHPEKRDFLNAYLDQAPIGLALMRAVECAHLSRLPFPRPILDIGVGDGTFARILFNGVIVDAGIDADGSEIERAKRTRCYSQLETARVEELPFGSESFATVFSNCVLEHIAEIESGLLEIHRVLRREGRLYMTVPNPRCTTFLLWRQLFARLGLPRVGDWYADWTLKLFKAENIMEPEEWSALLRRIGFVVEHHEPYMPLKASRIQELFLPTAVLSVVSKTLLGRKLIFPRFHRLKVRLYRRLLRDAYEERSPEGSANLLVARKVSRAAPSTQD
jgi:GT2 family glycosyltransferase/ubiquinone/menaquinone biosynthesis C-methylase UbiE